MIIDLTEHFYALLSDLGKQVITADWKDRVNVFTFPAERRNDLIRAFYDADISERSPDNVDDTLRGLRGSIKAGPYKAHFRAVNYDWYKAEDGGEQKFACESYLSIVPWTKHEYEDGVMQRRMTYSAPTYEMVDRSYDTTIIVFSEAKKESV